MCWDKKTVVLVGDAGCGKTAIAAKLTENIFLENYEPTDFERYQAEVQTVKGVCNVTILDTSGLHQEGRNHRALAYRGCDAVILCFDLTDVTTLHSLEQYWIPELKATCPGVPFYIAGCKCDAMCKGSNCTCADGTCCTHSESELLEIVLRTGAVAYTECSAAAPEGGLEDMFQMVVESCSTKKKNGAKKMISSIKKRSKLIKRRISTVFP